MSVAPRRRTAPARIADTSPLRRPASPPARPARAAAEPAEEEPKGLAGKATDVSTRGSATVAEVVRTMGTINGTSAKIVTEPKRFLMLSCAASETARPARPRPASSAATFTPAPIATKQSALSIWVS